MAGDVGARTARAIGGPLRSSAPDSVRSPPRRVIPGPRGGRTLRLTPLMESESIERSALPVSVSVRWAGLVKAADFGAAILAHASPASAMSHQRLTSTALRAKSPKARWLPALDVPEKDGVVGVVGAVEL